MDPVDALQQVRRTLTGQRDEQQGAQVLAALHTLRDLRDEIANWEPQLISAARDSGVSWAGLAPALGVTSRQAAERRYLRLRPSTSDADTKEGRVRAERTERAVDRAVASWARTNSATLRGLAAQIGALDDLGPSGRRLVTQIRAALAEDDPVVLLAPLADAQKHLADRHSDLAEQIRRINERTAQIRRETARLRTQPGTESSG